LTAKNFNPNRGDFPPEESESDEEYNDEEDEGSKEGNVKTETKVKDENVEILTEKLKKV